MAGSRDDVLARRGANSVLSSGACGSERGIFQRCGASCFACERERWTVTVFRWHVLSHLRSQLSVWSRRWKVVKAAPRWRTEDAWRHPTDVGFPRERPYHPCHCIAGAPGLKVPGLSPGVVPPPLTFLGPLQLKKEHKLSGMALRPSFSEVEEPAQIYVVASDSNKVCASGMRRGGGQSKEERGGTAPTQCVREE